MAKKSKIDYSCVPLVACPVCNFINFSQYSTFFEFDYQIINHIKYCGNQLFGEDFMIRVGIMLFGGKFPLAIIIKD